MLDLEAEYMHALLQWDKIYNVQMSVFPMIARHMYLA